MKWFCLHDKNHWQGEANFGYNQQLRSKPWMARNIYVNLARVGVSWASGRSTDGLPRVIGPTKERQQAW